ncbi:MAG: tRNA-guanine(15) transglycosylase, partial [Archaeoglobaceae archaeon]|nr:tRNA-guanine(15) transglycosylase [Archaeoglobaceae archaeon]MDW8118822.1 tRNA-guanine(15) transglycosylase [Archaeoglobaceae archaeon]
LVEKRIRAHPNLISAWRIIKDYYELFERSDPWIKTKFLYCGVETLLRPAVKRHLQAVKQVEYDKDTIVISSDFGILADIYLRPVFGPVPIELLESYPAGHAEIPEAELIEKEALEVAVENLRDLMSSMIGKKFVVHISDRWKDFVKDLPGEVEYVLH